MTGCNGSINNMNVEAHLADDREASCPILCPIERAINDDEVVKGDVLRCATYGIYGTDNREGNT